MKRSTRYQTLGAALMVLTLAPALAMAVDAAYTSDRQVVDGVAIYFGILPAELVHGHPREHPESKMHGGVVVGESHVLVGLFDTKSGEGISGAEITARVTADPDIEVRKPLETMVIGDRLSYGNYFLLKGPGPFRLELRIRRPGTPGEIRAVFVWARS